MYYTYNDYWLAHHGILGQKWGVRNGPPYPLGSDVSTGSRLKSGASGTSVKTDKSKVQTNKKVKAAANSGIGLKPKTREYTIEEDIAAVNPKFNPNVKDWEQPEYRTNCCYCSAAYEMRRRGYDVQASPRSNDDEYHELTDWRFNPNEAMFDFKERRTRGYGVRDDLDQNPLDKPLPRIAIKKILGHVDDAVSDMPLNARGVLTLDWYCGGGHSIVFENTETGVMIIDAQSNEKWNNTVEFFNDCEYVNYLGNIWVTRVDDVDVIPGKIKGACR